MPPQLTDYELETAARACRALAHVKRESAEKISDPPLRGPVQQRAQCAAELEEKSRRCANAPNARAGTPNEGAELRGVDHAASSSAAYRARVGARGAGCGVRDASARQARPAGHERCGPLRSTRNAGHASGPVSTSA
jgi:hypothetical protein